MSRLAITLIKFAFPVVLCMLMSTQAFAQGVRKEPVLDDFRGSVSVTQNGISLIPSFSLSEPALLFDIKFVKKRFSFEPDMRFALEGKPWSFIFWFRHKAIQKEKFTLRVGAHPALNFRTINIMRNGINEEILESRRYVAGEIAPDYKITENAGLRMYYLAGRGFDEGVKQTHFVTFNPYINNLHLTKSLYFNISPQLYYLQTDDLKGLYLVAFLKMGIKDFPLTISSILNKALDTEIAPEKDFIWNISLDYNF